MNTSEVRHVSRIPASDFGDPSTRPARGASLVSLRAPGGGHPPCRGHTQAQRPALGKDGASPRPSIPIFPENANPSSDVTGQEGERIGHLLRLVDALVRGLAAVLKSPSAQGERLLAHDEVAQVLGVSRVTLYRLMPRLRARGLRAVTIPAAAPRRGRREGRER